MASLIVLEQTSEKACEALRFSFNYHQLWETVKHSQNVAYTDPMSLSQG